MRRSYLFITLTTIFLALGIVMSMGSWAKSNSSGNYAVLALLAAVCLLPIIINNLRHSLDVFEPIYAFVLSTFIYFVFVPLVQFTQDSFRFLGKDYSADAGWVTLLALLSLTGFYLGYYWRTNIPVWNKIVFAKGALKYPRMRALLWQLSFIIFGVFAMMTVLWIVIARVPLNTLWVIGQATYGDAWLLSSGPTIGYFYNARDSLIALILMLFVYRAKKRWPIIELGLLVALTLFFVGGGVRYRLLLLVLAVLFFYFLQRGERPRSWQYVLVAFLVFYFVIGGVGFFRGQTMQAGQLHGLAIGEDPYSVQDAWKILIDNSQISVSTAVLVHTIPEYHPYFYGRSFLNLFTQPIPRFLWPEKPTNFGQDFFDNLWPKGTTVPFWALFFLNFGPVAIVPGMILWGYISRRIYDAYSANPKDELHRIQLAVYWSFIIQMYGRGGDNFAFNVYGWVFLLAPVWIVLLLREKLSGYYQRRFESSDTSS